MNKLFTISLLSLLTLPGFAQKQNNIWYFGNKAGIDFSSGSPVALIDGVININEGPAVISDSAGNLLFYSDGIRILNSLHDTLENATGLMGCPSTSQSHIVPKPGTEDSIYYLFTADCMENNLASGLRYHVIDMKFNGGLGKVTEKNKLLYYPVTEKMTSVTHANGEDFWIITHEAYTNKFLVFLVSCNGIDTIPVVSSIGDSLVNLFNVQGQIKVAPNGQKIAMTAKSIVQLFDFDAATGSISNPISLPVDSSNCEGAISFSPGNSKLYTAVACIPYSKIFQYDLLAGTPIDIINSKTQIFSKPCSVAPPDTCIAYGAMQIAPDGKIYVGRTTFGMVTGYEEFIGVINEPDSVGLACAYDEFGFYLAGRLCKGSVPNLIETPFNYIGCNTNVEEQQHLRNLFEIFPNPARQELNVKLYIPYLQEATLEIYNSLGELMDKMMVIEGNTDIKVSLNAKSKGLYFIRLSTNKTPIYTQTKKVIIN